MSRTSETKSPSSRLRGILYRLWEKDNKGFESFEEYYESMMESIIEFYKGKL